MKIIEYGKYYVLIIFLKYFTFNIIYFGNIPKEEVNRSAGTIQILIMPTMFSQINQIQKSFLQMSFF